MAPPPEYDKEPKAPDKSATNIPSEESKALYNLVNEQQNNSEVKTTNSSANAEVENNKHVETLDDGQLRALLDEAITYKCPKDREGKSNLFKELLESVEQDEQACKAAARGAGRARRAGGRARPALPHSNSLQDLVAALAAEPAPRRRAHHAPAPAPVSARAIHGGSLPSGVDTSFLLSEEPVRATGGAEYVATVRCVNPSPLAERRVSASDAPDTDPLRRSKPAFPMTYTARATLEIGGGGGGGRAVTSTTASHQVRTPRDPPPDPARRAYRARVGALLPPPAHNPPNVRRMTVAPEPSPHADQTKPDVGQLYPTKTYRSGDRRKSSRKPKKSSKNDSEEKAKPKVPSKPKSNTETSKVKAPETELVEMVSLKGASADSKNSNEFSLFIANQKKLLHAIENNNSTETSNETKLVEVEQTINKNIVESSDAIKEDNNNESPKRLLMAIQNKNHTETELNNKTKPIEVKKTKNEKRGEFVGSTKGLNKNESERLLTPIEIKNCTETVLDNETNPINAKPKKDNLVECIDTTKDVNKNESERILLTAVENKIITETAFENENKSINVKLPNENRAESIDTTKKVAKNDCENILLAINKNKEKGLDDEVKPIDIKPSTNESLSEDIDTRKAFKRESEKPPVEIEIPVAMDSADDEVEKKRAKVVKIRGATGFKVSSEKAHVADGPSSASILLTLYKRLQASPCNVEAAVVDLKSVVEPRPRGAPDAAAAPRRKDKITSRLSRKHHEPSMKKNIIRNALTKLFLDNVTQSDCTKLSDAGAASEEVDSAIPFSCITTPEVVGAAAPAPVDLKMPRTSLTGGYTAHGAPLPRPGATFGAVAAAAAEEFKKSLDENGNSLPGFSSPQSGSSQQKKQRRKKTSKNETVIKSHQIDGYQGNKDLNEVLRFIESAEPERGAKRHDDKKKRSAERRKDKAPRASSLDDLSRAAAAPPARPPHAARPAPAKPERRSWGDDARAYFAGRDPEPEPLELTDFQTVTKKRKPRRRADEPEPRARRAPDPPPSPPSPRARSDPDPDSNDDRDSVHSLPALPAPAPAPPPPLASYADIARTRHNIPDLIESCNYYGEGEEGARLAARARRGGRPAAARGAARRGAAPARHGRRHVRLRRERAAAGRRAARPLRPAAPRAARAALPAARAAPGHAPPAPDHRLRRLRVGGRGALRRRQGALLQRVGARPSTVR